MHELTLGGLVADAKLGLAFVVLPPGLESRTLESVHATDLAHPGRYVLPGEIVLTNGLWLPDVRPRQWVAEMRDAGAVSIGFGLSADTRTVPRQLVAACEALRMPLIAVPEDVSFSRIADFVSEHTKGRASAALRSQLVSARRLVQRMAVGGSHEVLLEFLAAETGLSGAFVGPGGRTLIATAVPPDTATAKRAAVAALHGELPCCLDERWSVFGVPGQLPESVLVVRAQMRDMSDEVRLLVEQVATYAAFLDARVRALGDAQHAIVADLISLVLADRISDSAFASRLRTLGLDPQQPIAPVASDVQAETLHYAAGACRINHAVASMDGYQLLLLEDPAPGIAGELADAVRDTGTEPVLGFASPGLGAPALRRAIVEASAALHVARRRETGDRVVREPEVRSHGLLLELLNPHELDAFRESILGPLVVWDREHGSSLVETLRTFLELGGHWRAAAAALHIHHNTLRYRLERVEELTGRTLSETSNRVDLFLALVADAQQRRRARDRSSAYEFVRSSTSQPGEREES